MDLLRRNSIFPSCVELSTIFSNFLWIFRLSRYFRVLGLLDFSDLSLFCFDFSDYFWFFVLFFRYLSRYFPDYPRFVLIPFNCLHHFRHITFYRHITFSRTMHLNWISICCLSLNCYYKAYKCCFSDEVTRKREVTNAYEANARDHTTYEYMRPRYKCFHFFALYFSRVPQWGMNLSSAKHTYHWNDVSSTSQFWMYYL